MSIQVGCSVYALEWENTVGGSERDRLHTVKQTQDGGYVLGGYSISDMSGDKTENSIGESDCWVVKLNSSGNVQWDNTIGGIDIEYLFAMNVTADGGYILGGMSISEISGDKTANSKGDFDYWIIKLNASGIIQWQKTIGGNQLDDATTISANSRWRLYCRR